MLPYPDITEWVTLWAPDEGAAITQAVKDALQKGLEKQAIVYFSMYALDDPGIIELLVELGKQNRNSRFLLDRSQWERPEERKLVAPLLQLPPDQWAIGESSAGRILHAKIIALLYPDGTGWTFSGSFNLSPSAEKEYNIVDMISSRSRAESFVKTIMEQFGYVKAREGEEI